MERSIGESHLFVVRIWRRLAQFRASVRRVDGEEGRVFDSAEEVAQYLEQQSTTPRATVDHGGPDERDG